MSPVTITGDQLFYLIISAMLSLLAGWCILFVVLRNKDEQLKMLWEQANLLRILTVIFVAIGSAILAVMGVFKSEAVSPIYGAIVGFVLGGIRRSNSG